MRVIHQLSLDLPQIYAATISCQALVTILLPNLTFIFLHLKNGSISNYVPIVSISQLQYL